MKMHSPEWRESVLDTLRKRHSLATDVKVGIQGFTPAMTKSTDPAKRDFTACITAETLDRDREVLLPSGMDPSEFKKTGAIFWNHDYDIPIGHGDNLVKDATSWSSDGHIMTRPVDWKGGDFFPDFAWEFIKQVPRPGISVGYCELEGRNPSKKDKELYGDEMEWTVCKWRLLEYSVAPLQACVPAVVTAVKSKQILPEVAKLLMPGIELPRLTARKTVLIVLGPGEMTTPVRPKKKGPSVEVLASSVSRAVRRATGGVFE